MCTRETVAFVELLEWHETHSPTPSGANGSVGFAYVDCRAASFLCHVWQVQHPALVHFRVDMDGAAREEDVGADDFATPLEQLRPVEVRVFDLGLQQDVSPLPPGVFPSRLEQMKALTMNDGAYTVEDEYHEPERLLHQFYEQYYVPACNEQGSFLDYISEADNWIRENIVTPIGLTDAARYLGAMAFSSSLVFGTSYYLLAHWVGEFCSNFLGQQRTEKDELVERIVERERVMEKGGVFGGMQMDFLDWIEGYVEDQMASTESAAQPVVTTRQEEVRSMFAGLRENVRSIWAGL